MRCKRSVIITTLLRLHYLLRSFGNCAITLFTETGLRRGLARQWMKWSLVLSVLLPGEQEKPTCLMGILFFFLREEVPCSSSSCIKSPTGPEHPVGSPFIIRPNK